MDRTRRALVRIFIGVGCVLALASGALPGQPSGFGDPLPGLTADEQAGFLAGMALFQKVFTPRTGLGPLFNGVSCAECHSHPAAGGSSSGGLGSDIFETRFRVTTSTTFLVDVVLQPEGAPVIMNRSVVDEFAAEVPGCMLGPEVLPPSTVAVSLRNTPPIFGGGLIEAIPDETILANADPEDLNVDRVSGVPNFGVPGATNKVGRFGWRGLVADLMGFTLGALQNEMGITNPLFPVEIRPQGKDVPPGCDVAADPEDDGSMAALIAEFQRFLAPPPRGKITEQVLEGDVIFKRIGCPACHIPVLRTGPHPVAALAFKDVPLFSDLLIHNMGPDLEDGVAEGSGTSREWRTTPLWGAGTSGRQLLHDGRAGHDFRKAIMFHGGEAAAARSRFQQLDAGDREKLMAFLRSL